MYYNYEDNDKDEIDCKNANICTDENQFADWQAGASPELPRESGRTLPTTRLGGQQM